MGCSSVLLTLVLVLGMGWACLPVSRARWAFSRVGLARCGCWVLLLDSRWTCHSLGLCLSALLYAVLLLAASVVILCLWLAIAAFLVSPSLLRVSRCLCWMSTVVTAFLVSLPLRWMPRSARWMAFLFLAV